MHDNLILSVSLIGVLGVGAQWLAWRLQAPAIVLMSAAGLAVGPFWSAVTGHPILDPNAEFGELLRPIVSLAVAVILFEGGLNLRFHELKEAGAALRRLIFVGTPIAWALGSLAAHYAAGLSWETSILFAGILVVTGPTVIMPLLRQSKLGGRVGATLKWEGIVNDPVGALLAVAVFEVLRVFNAGDGGVFGAAFWILFAAGLGALLGTVFGVVLVQAFRRGLTPEYLKAPILFAAVLLCYALAEEIEHETGLVAVTAFGMALANSRIASLQDVRRFKESIAVLLISGVFVILTASLTPETIASAMTPSTLLFLALMLFVVRPVSAGLSTFGALEAKESILVGWIAPRGIVAVAISGFFAQRMVEAGYEDAERMIPLAFAMAISTVVLHGFTIGPLARRLGLARVGKPGVLLVGSTPWGVGFAKALRDAGAEVLVADANWGRLRAAREAGLDRYYGEVVSEDAELRLDHARFETVAAVSANEPYNALVCSHFAPELGRHHVFQLSTQDAQEDDPRAIVLSARGRTLGGRGRTYDAFTRDFYRGWVFSKTPLTEDYKLSDLRRDRPDADLLAEIRPDGGLVFLGPSRDPKAGPGAVIIAFGPAEPSKPKQQAKIPSTES